MVRNSLLKVSFVTLGLLVPAQVSFAQIVPNETVHVWPGMAPEAKGNSSADVPVIDVYLPKKNPTHTGILIFPGGSYRYLALDHEGPNVAAWLVRHNIAAFVLHYRVAPYKYPAPLLDAERAMRLVRSRSAQYGLSPDHFGVWGFSAGGHAASHLLVDFDSGKPASLQTDAIDGSSDRPDFGILSYPVISMDPAITHRGSHDNLLGANAGTDREQAQSNELQVQPNSPPAFLVAANDDPIVPVQNSILFYQAYNAQHLSVEMHLFAKGGHGFALGEKEPWLQVWPLVLSAWMMQHGWMGATSE